MTHVQGETILLTGATGFIGSPLLDRLRRRGDLNLVILSRMPPSDPPSGETWITCSMEKLTSHLLAEHQITQVHRVFHLGAFTPKGAADADCIDEAYRSNLLGTRALLEALPNVPLKVVFASTLDVYASGGEEDVLVESSPLGPISLYGASKLFCESLVASWSKQHLCGYAILRDGHIYGPGEEAYRKLVPEAIRTLLRCENPVIYGDGSTLRDLLYVDDAVEATLRAGWHKSNCIDPVNIVRGASQSIREIVEMLIALSNKPARIVYRTDRPAGRSMQFDNDRMLRVLGHWKLTSLEEGLRREIESFRKPDAPRTLV
jgi:nucleoside-diphosphate-sugar epimerase